MSKQYSKTEELDKNSTTITLKEGDILYHPAGVWHSVTSTEDSISINFSMKAMRMGEFVS
jgi:quercetin dioxygenase-like cupin family protein